MNLKSLVFKNVSRNLFINNAALVCQSARICSFNKPMFTVNNNIFDNQLSLLCSNNKTQVSAIIQRRFKGDKKKNKKEESSDDEDEEEVDTGNKDAGLNKDSKIITAMVTTMRADAIYKAIQKTSRSKIDLMFYEGKLRLNGKLLMKKSTHVYIGDEMDIVKGYSIQNDKFLNISRIEILKVEADEEQIALKARFFKNLLVENYTDHPWSPSLTVKEEGENVKRTK